MSSRLRLVAVEIPDLLSRSTHFSDLRLPVLMKGKMKHAYTFPEDGQAQCSNEDSSAALMLAPTNIAATNIADKFPSENIWVGLRFLYGADWTWDGGSLGSITSGGNCDPGWDKIGTMCYKRLRHLSSGLRFKDAKILCSTENAYIMMPQSQIEAQSITSALDCGTKTTTDFIQISTKTGSISADIHSTVHTIATTKNPTSMAESEITTNNPMTLPVTIMSVSGMVCIDKCASYCSEFINGSVDARQNVPYRVDRKSLSSYRRRHRSEPDSRTSSLYIGCVGCVILIMTVLFIIMLDFLPST
ncbi:Hypothetical predicted protein [Mytilus galloprovincialis]|uniref:C-type lectin domain-containing protein n=1 Tax=Mytilus galloprovincialis TaxID=29158 RepID=A0A8B6DWR9_MYTGA|nr:Hypothetical predicted protein [Mytilus galloprovincialis]